MRVLPEHLEWVTNLIGPANAKLCPSLPQRLPATQIARDKAQPYSRAESGE
jgi:hypothetical protein